MSTYTAFGVRWNRYKTRVKSARKRFARLINATPHYAVVHWIWSSKSEYNGSSKASISLVAPVTYYHTNQSECLCFKSRSEMET